MRLGTKITTSGPHLKDRAAQTGVRKTENQDNKARSIKRNLIQKFGCIYIKIRKTDFGDKSRNTDRVVSGVRHN